MQVHAIVIDIFVYELQQREVSLFEHMRLWKLKDEGMFSYSLAYIEDKTVCD